MITNIRKRQLELSKVRKTSDDYARLYNIVSENHNIVQAGTLFRNILEIDSNIDAAIMKSVDLLLELYNYNDPAVVNKHRQKVLESISKVRDASQFKNYIQRKIAIHKGKIKNKINKGIEKVHDNLQKSKEAITSNISNTQSNSNSEEAQKETLDMIYKVACENVTYDRIIKNYEKISKRFDFDKIVIENVFDENHAIREARSICKLIDTYDFPSISKFKIATENYLFVLSKNACPYKTIPVVEAIAEYFLINADDKFKYITELEPTLNDMSNYNPFNASDVSKIVNKMNKPINEDPLDNISLNGDKIHELLNKFKYNPTISEFEKLLDEIFNAVGPEEYILHVGDIIDTLNMINDDKTKFFDKLIEYNKFLYTYNGKDKTKLLRTLLSIYTKYSNIIDKEIIDNIDYALDESTVEEDINTLPYKLDMLLESLGSISTKNVIGLINEAFGRYSLYDIDDLTKVAKMDASIIDHDEFDHVLKEKLKDARRKRHKDLEDYQKIDCIKDNIHSLQNHEPDDHQEDITLDESIIRTKEMELCANVIYDFAKYPTTLKEMDIVNTIAMASEKVKSKLNNLSSDVSNVSRQFDAQMDQLKSIVNTKDMESENREAVISGRVLPKASRIIKLAIVSGAAYFISPAISVIAVLGYLGLSLDARSKERRKVLDEIELELEMTNRYLKKAEDDGSLEKQRELLKIKKKLESQKARLMYNMAFKHGETLPAKKDDD